MFGGFINPFLIEKYRGIVKKICFYISSLFFSLSPLIFTFP